MNPDNLPKLKWWWTHSVFHWYDHLTSIFVPSLGLDNVVWHMEALNKSMVKALSNTQDNVSLPTTEVIWMREAVLQNRMALDVLTAAQDGTCTITRTKCCVYVSDYYKKISGFLTGMNTQIGTLSNPSLSFHDWLNFWTGRGFFISYQRTLFWPPFSFCCSNHVLLFYPMSLHLVLWLFHCHNFKLSNDPFHSGRSTHVVSLGFNYLCFHNSYIYTSPN